MRRQEQRGVCIRMHRRSAFRFNIDTRFQWHLQHEKILERLRCNLYCSPVLQYIEGADGGGGCNVGKVKTSLRIQLSKSVRLVAIGEDFPRFFNVLTLCD